MPEPRPGAWRRLPVPFLLAAIVLLAVAPSVVRAAVFEVFTVRGVPVDETAETAAEAREVAIANGRQLAWELMFRRLTVSGDHGRLPVWDPVLADTLVRGVRVEEERTSAVRYLGRLSYVFDPVQVRGLLRGAGISFAETASKPVVVLPLWNAGGGPVLWEDANPWRDAWLDRPDFWGLVPFVLPLGDLTDITAVDTAAAVQGDAVRLAAMAARYDAGYVLVSEARIEGGRLSVTARRYGEGEAGAVAASWSGDAGADPSAAMATAIRAIMGRLDESWKRRNRLGTGTGGRLVAGAPTGWPGEWRQIRTRLDRVAAITAVEVLSMTRGDRRVALSYNGDPSQLRLALAQVDLLLEPLSATAAPATPPVDGAGPALAIDPDTPVWLLRLRPGVVSRPAPVLDPAAAAADPAAAAADPAAAAAAAVDPSATGTPPEGAAGQ